MVEALYTFVRLDTRAADIRWSRFSTAHKGTPLQARLRHIRRLSLTIEGTFGPPDAVSLFWVFDAVKVKYLSITLVLSGEARDWPVLAARMQRCAALMTLRIKAQSSYNYKDMARDVGVIAPHVHTLALEGVGGDLYLTSPGPQDSLDTVSLPNLRHLSVDDDILYDLGRPKGRCRQLFSKKFIPNLESLSFALSEWSSHDHDNAQQSVGAMYLLQQHGRRLSGLSVRAPSERCQHYLSERLPDFCPSLQSLRMTDLVHSKLSHLPATVQLLDIAVCNSESACTITEGLQHPADTPSTLPMLRTLAIRKWQALTSETAGRDREGSEGQPESSALAKLRQTRLSQGVEIWSTKCAKSVPERS